MDISLKNLLVYSYIFMCTPFVAVVFFGTLHNIITNITTTIKKPLLLVLLLLFLLLLPFPVKYSGLYCNCYEKINTKSMSVCLLECNNNSILNLVFLVLNNINTWLLVKRKQEKLFSNYTFKKIIALTLIFQNIDLNAKINSVWWCK